MNRTVELTVKNSSQYRMVSYCDFVNLTLPSDLPPPCQNPKWYQQPSLGDDGPKILIVQAKKFSWQINLSKTEAFGVYCVKLSCTDQEYCAALAGISSMS